MGFATFAHCVNEAEMRKNLWTLFIAGFMVNVFILDSSAFPQYIDILVNSLGFLSPFILYYLYVRSKITSSSDPVFGQLGGFTRKMKVHGESYWLFSWGLLFLMLDFLQFITSLIGYAALYFPLMIIFFLFWMKYLGRYTMNFYYRLFVKNVRA